ncbi:hypothetical protein Pmani_032796, partial [Petrolisthes manimaculis]
LTSPFFPPLTSFFSTYLPPSSTTYLLPHLSSLIYFLLPSHLPHPSPLLTYLPPLSPLLTYLPPASPFLTHLFPPSLPPASSLTTWPTPVLLLSLSALPDCGGRASTTESS